MKRYIRLAITLIVIFAVLGIVYSLSRKGWLEVYAPALQQGQSAQITVEQADNEVAKFALSGGTHKKVRLGVGGAKVTMTIDDTKTIEVTTIRGFSTTKLTPEAGQKRAITKLGSNAEYCPVVVQNTTYSYDCHGRGLIYKHLPLDRERLDPRASIISDVEPQIVQQYRGGLIGYIDPSQTAMSFFDLVAETMRDIPASQAITDLITKEKPQIITSSSQDDSYFAYVFLGSNKIFIFDGLDDQQPVEVKLPDGTPPLQDIPTFNVQWSSGRLVVLMGQADEPFEESTSGPADETREPVSVDAQIIEYNQDGSQHSVLPLPDGFVGNRIFKLDGGFYATVLQRGEVIFYHDDGGKLTPMYNFPNISNPVASGGKLYFQDDGSIYTFEPKEQGEFRLRGVFTSPAIQVSELFAGPGDTIYFTGFSARETPAPLDAYQLLGDEQTTPPLEEVLRLQSISDAFTGYDYDNSRVIFALRYTDTPGATYGRLVEGIQRYLESKNMNTGGRAVDIGPLY